MATRGPGGKAALVMFDEETEALAARPASRSSFPRPSCARRLDSKIVTTQIGNEAGVPSVPNVIGRASSTRSSSIAARRRAGRRPGGADPLRRLGQDHLLHPRPRATGTPRGPELDRRRAQGHEADQLPGSPGGRADEPRHPGRAVHDDMIGYAELTPYKGGWCGNDIFLDVLTADAAKPGPGAHRRSSAPGWPRGLPRLLRGRLPGRPRHRRAVPGRDQPADQRRQLDDQRDRRRLRRMPLFLFHLLEYMDVAYEIDVDEINDRWARTAGEDVWSQVIIKETHPESSCSPRRRRPGSGRSTLAGESLRALGQRLARPASTRPRASTCGSPAGRVPLQGRRPRHPRHAGAGCRPTTTGSLSAAGSGSTASSRSSPAPRSLRARRRARMTPVAFKKS